MQKSAPIRNEYLWDCLRIIILINDHHRDTLLGPVSSEDEKAFVPIERVYSDPVNWASVAKQSAAERESVMSEQE